MPGTPPEVEVRLSAELGALVWREGEATAFEARLSEAVQEAIPDAVVRAFVEGTVPTDDRTLRPLASLAIAAPVPPATLPPGAAPLVRRIGAPHVPEAGLEGRHLALWPSHGWYYENSLDRWEWQRARVFTTVEDLLPFAFIQRHLAPMLERAGANVLIPRERDPQPNQAIVDNDGRADGRYAERGRWRRAGDGFAHRPPYRGTTNPFTLGTARSVQASGEANAEAVWVPEIPETGDYAVYVSYKQEDGNVEDARYAVRHAGGTTRFAVNQTMGGGTWVYLGTFTFARGADAGAASVVLTNASATPGRTVSADAVRFGGGMGEVERGGSTSGRPRWVEGARYYEQFAGFPDSTVYAVSGENDYKDDYQSRGEWVNHLRGAPYGPTGDRDARGLGIPVDLSLAFHTDAGRTTDGSVIGTLLIYNTKGMDTTTVFPDGRSRRANRRLAELSREDIVDDLRANWKTDWTFRDYWNRPYSEATRPNVPALLLELLSHHNPTDMRYALDPRFRHDASRAIYKSIGRFLAEQNGTRFVPQPLAPTHLVATFSGGNVVVSWMPQVDPLEPLARPTQYVLYRREDRRDGDASGWDGGTLVNGTDVTIAPPARGRVLSVRVAAVNSGGESEPSEALAVGIGRDDAAPILVVNGFDRTAAPAFVSEGDWIGFDRDLDEGVADGFDVNTVGDQYEFDTTVPWVDDDQPGHGGSDADLETLVLAGNTRDFVAVHGRALLASGRSFVSASDEAVMDGLVPLAAFPVVDLVMGEEKTTPHPDSGRAPDFAVWPAALRDALTTYARGGGRIFASGAYLGSDAAEDADAQVFLSEILGVRWRTGYAAVTGAVESVSPALLPLGSELAYNVDNRRDVYRVEAPDGLVPAGPRGTVALRYSENSISAGVVAPGAVTLGFPFEAIPDADARQRLMAAILRALESGAGRPGADR
ncbi:hypothetical protein BSZ36_11280 [Rubricoccus marinus]|uniref:Fibronectin type-III domain-containing protein n=2 Tax=Rubricoccus marinus TaxID=716817 RepID=A0A259U0I2_9BACT|nr:hypothetical protein BSZ36_11280 [Rubricoccus marinus]